MLQPRSGTGSSVALPLLSALVAAPLLFLACNRDWDFYDPRIVAASSGTGGAEPDAGTGGAETAGGTGGVETDAGTAGGGGGGGSGVGGSGGGVVDPHVTDGLVALYTFEEGAGAIVHDVSNVGTALDLTIKDPSAVTWAPGKLVVDAPTLISSGVAASKVFTRCTTTNELTLEAWFKPASLDLYGPARIVTNSLNTSERNFQLGQQYANYYEARIRSTLSMDLNGTPNLKSPVDMGHVEVALTHLLVTRDVGGVRRMYVNGTEVSNDTLGGDFSKWEPSYQLLMANELTEDRIWLGELHRIAIYDRALSAMEVTKNHQAGP
ncbi:LamG domain-containing protein [Polyangium aurulentum]|uniref:LamG domain-containing protein n=1 Tax=Polyangium aurulentum TaxID=2567896 RepID=UPI0010AE412D|nr:LamG domain-containing protein [Polyangium aurulentum]UQA59501.1 LamG domain-containing protein [Polyangium aurulentum]